MKIFNQSKPVSKSCYQGVPWSAFLLTGKTGENFPPDGTVQFFLQKKWNGSSCTI